MNAQAKTIFLFFAMIKEADAILHQSIFKFTKVTEANYKAIYNNTCINLILTGIGKKNIDTLIRQNLFPLGEVNPIDTLLIKAGTCAVINPEIELSKIIIPLLVCYQNKEIKLNLTETVKPFNHIIEKSFFSSRLITLDHPLISTEKSKTLLNQGYSFVDMETFFILNQFPNLPLIPLLVGTDRGNKSAKINFLKKLSAASQLLKEKLTELIKNY
jgi:hypothetical protein